MHMGGNPPEEAVQSRPVPFEDPPQGRLAADFVPGQHACLLYADDAEHAGAVVSFIRQGLDREEKVVYVTDAGTPRDIRDALVRDGVDAARYETQGQLSFVGADRAMMVGGHFDPATAIARWRDLTLRAKADGFRSLRATGEMTWACTGGGTRFGLWQYESAINALFADIGAIGLCQFDRRRFAEPDLLEAVRTHPWVAVGVEMHQNDHYAPAGKSLLETALESMRRRRKTEEEFKAADAERLRLQIILDEFRSSLGDA